MSIGVLNLERTATLRCDGTLCLSEGRSCLILPCKPGKGCYLDVSLAQAMLAFQANMLIQSKLEGNSPEVLAVPSGTYQTKYGWIRVAVVTAEQWPRFAEAIGQPSLIDDPRFSTRAARRENHWILNNLVAGIIKRETTAPCAPGWTSGRTA